MKAEDLVFRQLGTAFGRRSSAKGSFRSLSSRHNTVGIAASYEQSPQLWLLLPSVSAVIILSRESQALLRRPSRPFSAMCPTDQRGMDRITGRKGLRLLAGMHALSIAQGVLNHSSSKYQRPSLFIDTAVPTTTTIAL